MKFSSKKYLSNFFLQIPAQSDPKGPNMGHSMTWTEYHPKEDMESYLDYLASTYDFVTLETIGQSYEGTDMRVAKVSLNYCKKFCTFVPYHLH